MLFRSTIWVLDRDTVICISDYSLSRTQMVFDSLDSICYEFNLEKPMWLDSTVKYFKYHYKARFTQDNFIESIDFDFPHILNIRLLLSYIYLPYEAMLL